MDRELKVMDGNVVMAELSFSYDTANEGTVTVIAYHVQDVVDGIKTTTPLRKFDLPLKHDTIPATVEDIKAFDKQLLKENQQHLENYGEDLEHVYMPIQYRYLLEGDRMSGVADIHADFEQNKKEMRFVSAQSIRRDMAGISSGSLETNAALIKRVSEEQLQTVPDVYLVDLG